MDYSVIERAGLSPTEVARIVGISRVMMWRYITKGIAPRAAKVKNRMAVTLFVLGKLVDKGALPKPELAYTTRPSDELRARRSKLLERINVLVTERVEQAPANA